jgi:hypothetical protein
MQENSISCVHFEQKTGIEWILAHETNETIDDITRKNSLVTQTVTNAEQTEQE